MLGHLFGAPLVDGLDPFDSTGSRNGAEEGDKVLSRRVMRYFTNFVRTGSVHAEYKVTPFNTPEIDVAVLLTSVTAVRPPEPTVF